jgi:hypothetical protein
VADHADKFTLSDLKIDVLQHHIGALLGGVFLAELLKAQ